MEAKETYKRDILCRVWKLNNGKTHGVSYTFFKKKDVSSLLHVVYLLHTRHHDSLAPLPQICDKGT
jgi:hypothetical protein